MTNQNSIAQLLAERVALSKLSEIERDALRILISRDYVASDFIRDYSTRYDKFWIFTDMIWSDLVRLKQPEFIDIAIRRQIVEAILLNFDVYEKICWYIHSKCFEPDDYRTLFIQARDAFLSSPAIVGYDENKKPFTLADAINKIKLISGRGSDSMELAQFMEKLAKILDLHNPFAENLFGARADDFAQLLFDLCDLFINVSPEEAEREIELYLFPERADQLNEFFNSRDKDIISIETIKKIEEEAVTEVPMPAITPNNNPKPMPPTLTKPAPAEIRAKIDAAFEKDEKGNYKDLDGVFIVLGRAAQKYNDPKIAELYYFDETSGEFKWNV